MRRFLTLVCLFCLAIPAGITITGCTRDPGANYCNGQGYGMNLNDVASLTFSNATTGISLAFGQTQQTPSPSILNCKGTPVSVGTILWGTSNNQLLDISPNGNMCAGTWNRNTGGGIASYTICSPPNPLPSTGGLPYATVYITATMESVVSNPVVIFVHPPVTAVSLVTAPLTGSSQQCFSQGQTTTLDAQACFTASDNKKYLLCAPPSITSNPASNLACPLPYLEGTSGAAAPLASIPSCTAAIGTLAYSVGTLSVANIPSTNTTSNTVNITAGLPGTTVITASVAASGSSAGYFSTCPPKSISVTLANGATAGTITKGVTQNLVTTVIDTQGNPISGLSLDYQSTDPIDITATTGGSIQTNYPGVASVYAVCQPSSCNPSPIDQIGLFGTGLPLSSNRVTITTPGAASDYLYLALPASRSTLFPSTC